jgi:hypothetical protein
VPDALQPNPSTRPVRWAFALTAAAACALVLWVCALVWMPDFGLTRFINIGREFVPRGSAVYRGTPKYVTPAPGPDAGFDGQFYAEIALDPLLRNPQLKTALDDPPYRADRIFLPALAWIGGLGHPSWVLNVYAALNPIFWLGYAALLYVLFRGLGWAGVAGFAAMLLTCGVIESMYGALTDFPAFVLMTLAAMIAGSAGAAAQGLATLAREANILGLAGILEFEPPWPAAIRQNLLRGLVAVGPFALWYGYVRWRLPIHTSMVGANLDWPFHAILRKLGEVLAYIRDGGVDWRRFYRNEQLHALLTIIATLTQCLYLITHPALKNRLWRVGIVFVPYFFVISYNVWASHFTVTRHALPITLAFNLLLALRPKRSWLVWFLLGNCFVPYGLYRWVDFGLEGPLQPEFVVVGAPLPAGTLTEAYRGVAPAGYVAAPAGPQYGWAGPEHTHRGIWRWAMSQRGSLVLANAGRGPIEVRLAFASESLVPRALWVSVRGLKVWAGPIAAKPVLTPVRTDAFLLPPGETVVEFSTDVPATLENSNADARRLAFMVSDPAVVVTGSPPR